MKRKIDDNKLGPQLLKLVGKLDSRGILKNRENTRLDFKQSFNLNSMPEYAKTLASFANAEGGFIVFGVQDSPRKVVGVVADKFDNLQAEKVTSFLLEYFSPSIDWASGIFKIESFTCGYLYAAPAHEKPVICKKLSGNELREGAIYFRYRGQSKPIGHAELRAIYDEIRDRERRLWMSHIQKISSVGPSNIALVDLVDGEISSPNEHRRFLVDESLLKRMRREFNFVTEGKLSETEGAPTLKLMGTLEANDTAIIRRTNPDRDYPHIQAMLATELGIRPHEVQALVWKLGLRNNSVYHSAITMGRNPKNKAHKYSDVALTRLREQLNNMPVPREAALKALCKEYSSRGKSKLP